MHLGTHTTVSSQRRSRKLAALHRGVNHALESLETRRLYSVTATSTGGVLTVLGDNNSNAITVSRDVAGNLRVNNGAVAITGAAATVASIHSIRVVGQAGNDTITLDETNGPLPSANLSGGSGNDTLTGGAGNDFIDGGTGNDVLLGKGGADQLLGQDGDDILTGGAGADHFSGGNGNDQMIWNPGDGSDVMDGQNGSDTLVFNGAKAAEKIDISANAGRLRFFRDVGNITMDVAGTENVVFNALGGADVITVHNLAGTGVKNVTLGLGASSGRVVGGGDGEIQSVVVEGTDSADVISVTGNTTRGVFVSGLAATVNITGTDATDQLKINALGGNDIVEATNLDDKVMTYSVDGGAGNDVLVGSAGNDTLLGGDGNDILIGGAGLDAFDGGARAATSPGRHSMMTLRPIAYQRRAVAMTARRFSQKGGARFPSQAIRSITPLYRINT